MFGTENRFLDILRQSLAPQGEDLNNILKGKPFNGNVEGERVCELVALA